MWLFYAFLCPILTALSNVVDKIATDRHAPEPRALNALHSLPFLLLSLALIATNPLPAGALLPAAAAGLIMTFSYIAYFKMLRETDVSRAIGLVYTFPVFVAVGAFLLFNEPFTLQKTAGVLLVAVGATILATEKLRLLPVRALALILAVSLTEAAIELLQKGAVGNANALAVTGIVGLAFGLTSLLAAQPSELIKAAKSKTIAYATASGTFLAAAWLAFILAISQAQVSVVASISAIHPLAVLVVAAIVAKKAAIKLDTADAAQKTLGILLTMAGVAAVLL